MKSQLALKLMWRRAGGSDPTHFIREKLDQVLWFTSDEFLLFFGLFELWFTLFGLTSTSVGHIWEVCSIRSCKIRKIILTECSCCEMIIRLFLRRFWCMGYKKKWKSVGLSSPRRIVRRCVSRRWSITSCNRGLNIRGLSTTSSGAELRVCVHFNAFI